MRGIVHGACDYLVKPVRMEELRNIWQHVVRRRASQAGGKVGHPYLSRAMVVKVVLTHMVSINVLSVHSACVMSAYKLSIAARFLC